jgi:hypothetical protein
MDNYDIRYDDKYSQLTHIDLAAEGGAFGVGALFRRNPPADTKVRVWIRERRASSERRRWRKSTTSVSRRKRERHHRCPRPGAISNAQSALIPVHFLQSSAASAPG